MPVPDDGSDTDPRFARKSSTGICLALCVLAGWQVWNGALFSDRYGGGGVLRGEQPGLFWTVIAAQLVLAAWFGLGALGLIVMPRRRPRGMLLVRGGRDYGPAALVLALAAMVGYAGISDTTDFGQTRVIVPALLWAALAILGAVLWALPLAPGGLRTGLRIAGLALAAGAGAAAVLTYGPTPAPAPETIPMSPLSGQDAQSLLPPD